MHSGHAPPGSLADRAQELCVIVCMCEGITDRDVKEAAAHGVRSLERLGRMTGAGTSCGSCHSAIRDLLAGHAGAASRDDHARADAPRPSPSPMPR